MVDTRGRGMNENRPLRKSEVLGAIKDVEQLEEVLSRPDDDVITDLGRLDGDILVLGASGKMGPTLARMARRAAPDKAVHAVARFSDASVQSSLKSHGIETIRLDLLEPDAMKRLPKVKNVVLMTGFKFGAMQAPARTWATNALLAAQVSGALRDCRLVAF